MRCRLLTLLTWSAFALVPLCRAGAQRAPGADRCALAVFEVRGPLRRAVLDLGSLGSTEVALELGPGEQAEVELPLPAAEAARELGLEPSVREVEPAEGALRFVAWRPPAAAPEDLPPGLRLRPHVAVGARAGGLRWVDRLFALAAFALVLAQRKRPGLALGLGLAAAALAFALAQPDAPRARRRIYEIDAQGGHCLAVDSLRGPAVLGPIEPLELAVEPAAAPLAWRVDLRSGRAAVWELDPGAGALRVLRAQDLAGRALGRAGNAFAALEPCYTRDAHGQWSERGPWELGAPLPEVRSAPSAPPGDLNPALPYGIPILVGRVRDVRDLPAHPDPAPDEAWVRVFGLP